MRRCAYHWVGWSLLEDYSNINFTSLLKISIITATKLHFVAWEDSQHLVTLQLVSPPNDVWETSAEIPYWWRVTTQIWRVVLLVESNFQRGTTNQKHYYPDLRHQYGISALVSHTSFGCETSGSVAKCRLFSQAIHFVERKNLVSGPSSHLLL